MPPIPTPNEHEPEHEHDPERMAGEDASAALDIGRELNHLLSRHPEFVQASQAEDGTVRSEPILCFLLADVWFGVPTAMVRHVVALPTIYPVPTTPAHVLGVANLTGQVTPVIDLKRFLGLNGAAAAAGRPFAVPGGQARAAGTAPEIGSRRMVVVQAAGLAAGFPVDLVREVVDVPAGSIEEARVSEGRVREFARGELRFRRRVLTVLDLPALLQAARVQPPQAQAQGTV